MTVADDIAELVPGTKFVEGDETKCYWIKDGQVVFRHYPCKGADPSTFRFYRGSFGKDAKHAYCTFKRLSGGSGATFRALNYTYYTDGNLVWTLGGQIKEADAQTFVVCDDGVINLFPGSARYYYGFARDKANVYYYDSQGKTKIAKKADPFSFVSLNDGYFGKDDNSIFFGAHNLPKSNLKTWRRTGPTFYTCDDSRVYYGNQLLKSADYNTFEVVKTPDDYPLAKDKSNYFQAGNVISAADFNRFMSKLK